MKLRIVAVGRAKAGPEKTLLETYAKRLTWPLSVEEVEEKRPLSGEALKTREAELLLAAVDGKKAAQRVVIALDEHGKSMGSRDFAKRIGQLKDQGVGEIVFLIGGADGHGKAVLDRADLKLSLGALTWPHMLVRALLAEQLYRAQQILAGHPYHRD
jgi:23S rRNA (pseudouridine1915-N3)-methyltransferase